MDRRCCQRCTQSETCIGAVRGARLSGEQKEPRDTANSANCFRSAKACMSTQCATNPLSSTAKGTNTWSPPYYLLDTGGCMGRLLVVVELPILSHLGSIYSQEWSRSEPE